MRHTLTNINETQRTATCSLCGNTPISIRNKDSDNKSKWRCSTRRKHKYRRKHSKYITLDVFLEKRKVNECEICGKTTTENKRKLSIDHCHVSMKVRGVLCNSCNIGLGNFNDSEQLLKKAQQYLKKYREPQ